MAKRQRRTTEEILADLKRKENMLQARIVAEKAADHPILSTLYNESEGVAKNLASAQRKLNGPQSFAIRRQAFTLRMAEIDAGEKLAKAEEALYTEQREYLRKHIGDLVQNVVDNKPVSKAEVEKILRNIPNRDLTTLISDFQEAWNARKSYRRAEMEAEAAEENIPEEVAAAGS